MGPELRPTIDCLKSSSVFQIVCQSYSRLIPASHFKTGRLYPLKASIGIDKMNLDCIYTLIPSNKFLGLFYLSKNGIPTMKNGLEYCPTFLQTEKLLKNMCVATHSECFLFNRATSRNHFTHWWDIKSSEVGIFIQDRLGFSTLPYNKRTLNKPFQLCKAKYTALCIKLKATAMGPSWA